MQTATVTLSDERKKLQIPWDEVQEYFVDKETAGEIVLHPSAAI